MNENRADGAAYSPSGKHPKINRNNNTHERREKGTKNPAEEDKKL
jgi:hypothetical protein